MTRLSVAPIIVAVLSISGLWANNGWAYPQFVFKGLGDCGSCHHSPSGGGLPNRWGRESLDVTLGKNAGLGFANDDLAYDPAHPAKLTVDLGVELRLVPIFGSDGAASLGPTLIPMLTEFGGAAAIGRWTVYATVTAKKGEGSGAPYLAFSREHWLEYQAAAAVDIRAGRLVVPFGVRQPDHTQYVREDFGFDKYDQSYGVELDLRLTGWSLFGGLFVGNLTYVPPERQERAIVVTPTLELGSGAAVGVSVLGAVSTADDRVAGSLFGRFPLGERAYLLAEIALQRRAATEGSAKLTNIGEYLRLGWFARPEMDVFVEAGHRAFLDRDGLTKERVGMGVNWQLLRWFEFAPQVFAEARSDLPTRFIGLAQLHLTY
jgi:hypothetical protein